MHSYKPVDSIYILPGESCSYICTNSKTRNGSECVETIVTATNIVGGISMSQVAGDVNAPRLSGFSVNVSRGVYGCFCKTTSCLDSDKSAQCNYQKMQ